MTDYFLTKCLRRMAAVALTVASGFACAAPAAQDEPEELEKVWQEIALQLPAAPVSENLLAFYVSPTATQTFSIDSKSITVGKDGVVRYTLVSTSKAGAKNISFEGIRCELLQKRLYAFGRADGSWSRSRREAWDPISGGSPNNQHATLVNDFLCQDKMVAGTAPQIIERLRSEGRIGDRKRSASMSD